MAKLGVVTCQILELEIAHVLSNDPDVSEIWVVDDEFSIDLAMALGHVAHKPVHRVAGVEAFPKEETNGLAVLVQVLEVGLHSNIPDLTRGVTMANYERSLILPTPVLGEAEMRENIQEFNEKYDLKTDVRPGTLMLLENAWEAVKKAARQEG